jgi:hypothetical protein
MGSSVPDSYHSINEGSGKVIHLIIKGHVLSSGMDLRMFIPQQASRIWKGCLTHELNDFDFLHCETVRIRENSFPVRGVSFA